MSLNWPIDPIGGDSGWANYGFYLVSFTTKQGTAATVTVFARSTTDAIAAVQADKGVIQMYVPLTGVSAAPSSGTGTD